MHMVILGLTDAIDREAKAKKNTLSKRASASTATVSKVSES